MAFGMIRAHGVCTPSAAKRTEPALVGEPLLGCLLPGDCRMERMDAGRDCEKESAERQAGEHMGHGWDAGRGLSDENGVASTTPTCCVRRRGWAIKGSRGVGVGGGLHKMRVGSRVTNIAVLRSGSSTSVDRLRQTCTVEHSHSQEADWNPLTRRHTRLHRKKKCYNR